MRCDGEIIVAYFSIRPGGGRERGEGLTRSYSYNGMTIAVIYRRR